MAQARQTEQPIRLRVVAEKYMESETKTGGTRIVSAPWKFNTVMQNKKKYGPGEVFEVTPLVDSKTGAVIKTAEQVALDLLATGSVQKADDKPKPFRPPFLTHEITPNNGVVLRKNIDGKIPTRTGADVTAAWEGDDYEQGF